MNFIKDLQFGFGRRLPLILQSEASECGLACLAMIVTYYGYQTNLPELRKRFRISLKGTTLNQVIGIADQLGMISRPLRLSLKHISKLQVPAILHWNLNHFVVLKQVRGTWVYIHDPAIGHIKMTLEQVSEHFTGVALELAPGLTFKRKAAPESIQLTHLMGHVVGLKRGLIQIFGLALALEILALVLPILTEWITDEAIVSGDRDLLAILTLGMIIVGISSVAIGSARSWIGLYVSTSFNMQWMSNVMGRLLKLPVEYFERRHLGDIVSRFGAVSAIENGLTNGLIDVFLDGLLAIGTLIMMLIYNVSLTLVTLAAVGLYGLLRWVRYGAVRMASAGLVAARAKEQTYFLETIRGARSIKLFGRESERRSSWLNLWVASTNTALKLQKANMIFGTSWGLLSTLERAGVFWLGAVAVIDHRISLGMFFAFLTYKEQFSARINQLIDRVVEFKMLGIQAERLSDIVLSPIEDQHVRNANEFPDDTTLVFEDVNFRYARDEPYLLRKAKITIKPGECVAIVGPSGCGKTTFLKLALGILKPSNGHIKIGGLTIQQLGLPGYRSMISAVMQDDQVFAGSLYENICLLDDKPDEEWVYKCAQTACIHDEIMAMPMGYQTLVGDMGSILSGGQKQRVLLARALYKKPQILFLDEATSHLDTNNESKIGHAIERLAITRVMIAHRPQTISVADRILRLEGGEFIDVTGNFRVDNIIELNSIKSDKEYIIEN